MVSELSCQIFVFEYQPDCKDMLRNVQVISTRREDGYDRENYTSALQMIHPVDIFWLGTEGTIQLLSMR